MLYVLNCTDKPGHLEVRMKTREAHLAYLKTLGAAVKLGGPFLDMEGKMNGSMLVIEAADQGAIENIAAEDPYAKAGLFSRVEIKAWRWGIGNPEAK